MTDVPGVSPPFSVVRTDVGGDRARVTVRGELDAFTAQDVHAVLAGTTQPEVELDLSGVTFIDSSGLAAVIEGHLRLGQEQRRLVIGERSEIVQRLLELSGVPRHLDLDPAPKAHADSEPQA